MNTTSPIPVLHVEDSPTDALLTREEIGQHPEFRLTQVTRLDEALHKLAAEHYDVVLLDLGLPDSQGLDTLVRLRREVPEVPIVVLTGTDDEALGLRALQKGGQDYITKSQLREQLLVRTIRYAIERKRAAKVLHESEELFRGAFEHTNVAMGLTDLDNRFLRVNTALADLFGYSMSEMLQRSVSDITHPDDLTESLDRRGDLIDGKAQFFQREERYLHKEGRVIWGLTNISLIRDANGKPFQYVGLVQDITERKRAEAEVRRTGDLLRAVAEGTTDAIFVKDRQGKYLFINEAAARFVGKSVAEVLGKDDTAIFEPESARLVMARDHGVMNSGSVDTAEETLTAAGTTRTYLATKGPYRDGSGNVIGVIGISHDITDQGRLAAERDALLTRLQLHIERLPLAYILFDSHMRISDWNPTAERIFGYTKDEVLGDGPPYEKWVPRACWKAGEAVLKRIRMGDMSAHSINENLTKDGRPITCQWFNTPLMENDGTFVGFLSLAQDITERKSLEEQVRQSQKMEAVGQLAAGVAHDFNNLLTIISGYSEIMLSTMDPNDPIRDSVTEISKAGERASALTRQLLAFSRKSVLELKVLDLNAIVREAETFLRRLIGEDILLTAVLDKTIKRVKVDPDQMGQVLMNLAVNARDAMPRGGKLTIATRNVDLDQDYARLHSGVVPGRYVMLSISDTGSGMTDEVKAHIFEPFFTTKGVGKGTGLGLAVVIGIVKQSNGHVEVYSEPDIGTTFKIYLPSVDETGVVPHGIESGNGERGTETILLVEDEDGVRGLAVLVLRTHGYRVLAAETGREALRLVEKRREPIDMLVTDVVMPGMSGPELAESMQPRFPHMKVLFASGYTDDAVIRHGLLHEKVAFLQKPYSPMVLLRKVRQVLDQR